MKRMCKKSQIVLIFEHISKITNQLMHNFKKGENIYCYFHQELKFEHLR